MAMDVLGKTALITGAGSGINFCFARLLLSKGCNVVLADLALRPEAQSLLLEYPLSSPGPKAVFQETDVTNWKQLDRTFEVASGNFGGADIVCPGAGVYEPPFSNFWIQPGREPSRDDVESSRYTTLDINLTHPIRVTQLAIAHFLGKKKPGVVVHISSVAGQVPFFPTPLYVASKHALNGLVRSLSRLETPPDDKLGKAFPKIRVVAVAPARILTPLWTAPENEDKLRMLNSNNAGWIMPEKVADVMLDLIEKEKYVGGTILEVGEKVRVVQPYNDPGPGGGGNEVGHDTEREERDMWSSMERLFNGV